MMDDVIKLVEKEVEVQSAQWVRSDEIRSDEQWICILHQEVSRLFTTNNFPKGLISVAAVAVSARFQYEKKMKINNVKEFYTTTMKMLNHAGKGHLITTAWEEYISTINRESILPYHNVNHVAQMIDAHKDIQNLYFDRLGVDGSDGVSLSLPVRLALLFHDYHYQPMGLKNEELSVEKMKRQIQIILMGLPADHIDYESIEEAGRIILMTRHITLMKEDAGALLLDLDLSILGSDEESFLIYEDQIRKEYSAVPDTFYHEGRKKVLAPLANRAAKGTLFNNIIAQSLYGAPAKRNLTKYL
jgi:predicted metal-dependent HD superfamily phosphohydrolase